MQDKITIADAPDCLNTNDKAMWVLGYEAAIEARGQCLHQIQEPEADIWPCVNIDVDESGKITNAKLYSPGLPAGNHDVYPVRVPYMDEHTEAWRACVDELEKAVPGFMSLGNMNGIECAVAAIQGLAERAKHQEPAAAEQAAWHAVPDEGRAQATGSVSNATFHAAQTGFSVSNAETHQAAPAAVTVADERAAFEQWLGVKPCGAAHDFGWSAWKARAALAATPAQPVVLPEPVAFALEWTFDGEERGIRLYDDERHCRLDAESDGGVCSPLYTEQQVRALLAQAAIAAAPAHPAEGVQAVEQGEVLVTVSGFTGCGKSAIAGEIEIMCRALGLQVEWPDGDPEKNLTHADWTEALELYKPRVRIVEQNIPFAAMKGMSK